MSSVSLLLAMDDHLGFSIDSRVAQTNFFVDRVEAHQLLKTFADLIEWKISKRKFKIEMELD